MLKCAGPDALRAPISGGDISATLQERFGVVPRIYVARERKSSALMAQVSCGFDSCDGMAL
jgi:hypothetical protein